MTQPQGSDPDGDLFDQDLEDADLLSITESGSLPPCAPEEAFRVSRYSNNDSFVAQDDHQPTSNHVTLFLDSHDIGKIPGIGFKMAQKIREHVLQRPAAFDAGLVYGGTKEKVTVSDVRTYPGMCEAVLDKLLGGPGTPRDVGKKVWQLLNGVDESDVARAREVPRQISIEDSYIRLDTYDEVLKELMMLAKSVIKRMRTDLVAEEESIIDETPSANEKASPASSRKWLAHPRTLRLSTRPRPPLNPDGTRSRTFNRISRSGPVPSFLFRLADNVDALAEKLVSEHLIPLFKKLHPEKSGWNLSLVNLAVTNMIETGSNSKVAGGRDIGSMFRQQDKLLAPWRVEDRDVPPDAAVARSPSPFMGSSVAQGEQVPLDHPEASRYGSPAYVPEAFKRDSHRLERGNAPEDRPFGHLNEDQPFDDGDWDLEGTMDDTEPELTVCEQCGSSMPPFAMQAHRRFHATGE